MKSFFWIVQLTVFAIFLLSFNSAKKLLQSEEMPIAFPGAEGFGKYATGGRGGQVLIVSTLEDAGPGSFRFAAESKGKRIIVFRVTGTIHLKTKITVKGDVTIAGQTAPGGGICLADAPVVIGGDNVIIRYLRFRMGDRNQNREMVDGSGADDALSATKRNKIIIDHCSMSWSTDECFSIYGGDSTTLQWNIIAEPLNYSYHFEAGDKEFERHGYGGIWGGLHLSAHHNLFAHCNSRTPRFNGVRHTPTELVDFRNNVIYNWGSNNIYAGEGGAYNIVNNYFKFGPDTKTSIRYQIVNPGRNSTIGYGQWFVDGNFVDGSKIISRDNWNGITVDTKLTLEEKQKIIVSKAHPVLNIPTQSAAVAYQAVLDKAGASYQRDTLDARVVENVMNRTGQFVDVQGGYPHGTNYAATVNAWPFLQPASPQRDTDQDGMPDDWEKIKGLNPFDARDASTITLHFYYTNIEVYLNSIVQ